MRLQTAMSWPTVAMSVARGTLSSEERSRHSWSCLGMEIRYKKLSGDCLQIERGTRKEANDTRLRISRVLSLAPWQTRWQPGTIRILSGECPHIGGTGREDRHFQLSCVCARTQCNPISRFR